MELNFRSRLTWYAHLFKACTKQDHRELVPVLSQLIDKDSVILDVGSHAGHFAKLFARLAPEGHVYAFEPASYALSILRTAIRISQLRNVSVFPFGFGDKADDLYLSVPIKPSGSVGFGLSHVSTTDSKITDARRVGWNYVDEVIELRTIDEFVENEQIDQIDYIKADIEGWEMRMLVGAKATLSRFHPSLMIEVVGDHLARAGDCSSDIFEYLIQLNYRAFKLDPRLTHFVEVTRPEDGDIFFVAEGRTRKMAVLLPSSN